MLSALNIELPNLIRIANYIKSNLLVDLIILHVHIGSKRSLLKANSMELLYDESTVAIFSNVSNFNVFFKIWYRTGTKMAAT